MLTSDLVARIKLRGALPEGRFTDEEILDFAYDALVSELVPTIIGMKEEYYVREESVTAADVLEIPKRLSDSLFATSNSFEEIKDSSLFD